MAENCLLIVRKGWKKGKVLRKNLFAKRFLWSRTKQFWKTCRETLATRPELFQSRSEIDREVYIFFEKTFLPKKVPMITYNAVLTTLLREFLQRAIKYSLNVRKSVKNLFFEMFWQIFRDPQKFICTRRMQVLLLRRKLCGPGRKCSVQCPKMMKRMKLFGNVFPHKMFFQTHRVQFWRSCPEFNCLMTEDDEKIDNFQGKIFRLKMFLWTRRMPFWQPCRYFFGQKPKNFHSMSENDAKKINFTIKNCFTPKCSYDRLQCSFDNPADKFFPERRKFSAHCSKLIKKLTFSKRLDKLFQMAPMFFCTRMLQI